MCAALCVLLLVTISKSAATKPHIVFMLGDDWGWYDTSIFGDQSNLTQRASHNLAELANQGMRIANHYVHWHCAPTRRSFLTGRLPLHHGEHLGNVQEDNIDLRWTWISEKLAQAGYVSHFYGKGHTGYKSMYHLPAHRGFEGGSVLFFHGGSYYNLERWNGTKPYYTFNTDPHNYSTDLFGYFAVKAVENHDPSVPFFLYLAWQAVHTPYDLPPACREKGSEECPVPIRAMIQDVDIWTGRLVNALKVKGMYENTLMVFTSDNGGTQDPVGSTTIIGGNNYPLRGGKHSNWQGAMRTSTFVSGGFLPHELKGKTHHGTFHVVDWYPTFCALAGVDGSDDPPVPLSTIDLQSPFKDIYGDESYPPVDGINIWDELTKGKLAKRKYLWLSAEVILKDGRYKLVTAQQHPNLTDNPPMTGWRQPDGSWKDGGELDGAGCGTAFYNRDHFKPCLFDLQKDEREEHDLSATMPGLVTELWAELNRSALTAFIARSPAAKLGVCNPACANAHWEGIYGKKIDGPICGVPGCTQGSKKARSVGISRRTNLLGALLLHTRVLSHTTGTQLTKSNVQLA